MSGTAEGEQSAGGALGTTEQPTSPEAVVAEADQAALIVENETAAEAPKVEESPAPETAAEVAAEIAAEVGITPSSADTEQAEPPAAADANGAETEEKEAEQLFDTSGVALLTPANPPTKEKAPKTKRKRISKDDPCLKKARMATSIEDIGSLRLWKGIVAEFVGTLLLTLIGCGSCIDLDPVPANQTNPQIAFVLKPVPVVQIALCFGLSVATIVWAIGHVSGGHINPAITAAMLVTRKISLVKGIFFIIFQLIGAVVGAGILYGLVPDGYHGSLGATILNSKLSSAQGFGVELFITFVLVFVVFSSCDSKRKDLRGSAPLTIGLSVAMCHLFAVTFTGSSMNTARSFGPAVVIGEWKDHWIYWVGPILGGMVAGVLYDNLFAVNASLAKAKACVLSSDYDDDKYKAQKVKVHIVEEEEPAPEGDGEELVLTETKADSDPSKV